MKKPARKLGLSEALGRPGVSDETGRLQNRNVGSGSPGRTAGFSAERPEAVSIAGVEMYVVDGEVRIAHVQPPPEPPSGPVEVRYLPGYTPAVSGRLRDAQVEARKAEEDEHAGSGDSLAGLNWRARRAERERGN